MDPARVILRTLRLLPRVVQCDIDSFLVEPNAKHPYTDIPEPILAELLNENVDPSSIIFNMLTLQPTRDTERTDRELLRLK